MVDLINENFKRGSHWEKWSNFLFSSVCVYAYECLWIYLYECAFIRAHACVRWVISCYCKVITTTAVAAMAAVVLVVSRKKRIGVDEVSDKTNEIDHIISFWFISTMFCMHMYMNPVHIGVSFSDDTFQGTKIFQMNLQRLWWPIASVSAQAHKFVFRRDYVAFFSQTLICVTTA